MFCLYRHDCKFPIQVKNEPSSPGSNFKVSSPSSTYSSSVGSPQMQNSSLQSVTPSPPVIGVAHARSRSAPVQPVIPTRNNRGQLQTPFFLQDRPTLYHKFDNIIWTSFFMSTPPQGVPSCLSIDSKPMCRIQVNYISK